MAKLLHFADAHIDMSNYGQHDPRSGLPLRVMDFLKSVDTIIQTAIDEKVDLVIFAGDAYKDRSPAPTFMREWGRRLMKLSRAQIPTLLLTGNHDISPAQMRAHSMQEFDTLQPPFLHVVSRPALLKPEDLDGAPVQVIALPWLTRAVVSASFQNDAAADEDPARLIEEALSFFVQETISQLDPDLPTILAAHASVAGAKFGKEREIMIGRDVLLQPGFVANRRFDYVALGHIHKHQDLNPDAHPPVVYPGSIERVDFGEVMETKGFVIADVSKGHTDWEFRKLNTRKFIELSVDLAEEDDFSAKIKAALPAPEALEGAVVRLMVNFPKGLENRIDRQGITQLASNAFEFKLDPRPFGGTRSRLGEIQETASLSPMELLDLYWKSQQVGDNRRATLSQLAAEVISKTHSGEAKSDKL